LNFNSKVWEKVWEMGGYTRDFGYLSPEFQVTPSVCFFIDRNKDFSYTKGMCATCSEISIIENPSKLDLSGVDQLGFYGKQSMPKGINDF
jgi:hypothetical protein